jgi:hypothetical protein
VRLDVLYGDIPDNLVPRTVILRSAGTAWSVQTLLAHHSMCLGLPFKVINQSVVGLSPLSETA